MTYSRLTTSRGGVAWLLSAALAVIGLALPAAAQAAGPSTLNVAQGVTESTSTACSLRDAIAYANATSGAPSSGSNDCASSSYPTGPVTINIPANTAHYTLTAGALTITGTEAITITGAGASSTVIDGGGTTEVFSIGSGTNVTLNTLEITGGTTGNDGSYPATNGLNGGGINNSGTLTLNNVTVTGNTTSGGGSNVGGGSFGSLGTCAPSNCDGGTGGSGGGIYSAPNSTLTINNSTISSNTTGGGGSGAFPGTYTSSPGYSPPGGSGGTGGYGAGIYESGATVTITNSTISGNTTGNGGTASYGSYANYSGGMDGSGGTGGYGGNGAGIYASGFGTGRIQITGSTITGNTTGAGGQAGEGGCCLGTTGAGGYGGNGGYGGGVEISQAATLTNDTITGNSTGAAGPASDYSGGGPGIPGEDAGYAQFGRPSTVSSTTISGNTTASYYGGIYAGAAIVLQNSIVSGNTATSGFGNCGGAAIADNGNNVYFGDQSNCPTGGTNESTKDPKLGSLADNGGPVKTQALQPGSSAIDIAASCPQALDERGVSRPQGAACDAGAYEYAPPAISGVAGAPGSTTTGTVTANVNPNLSSQDTTVVVKYGPTTAYGSTTTAKDIGRGSTAVPYSAALTGLAAGTTYHYAVVATNGDGPTTSADGTFTTTSGQAATASSPTTAGPVLTVTVTCNGGDTGAVCSGPITLTSHVTTTGKTVIGTAARTKHKKHKKHKKAKPKKVTTVQTVGTSSYSVLTGQSKSVTVTLNKTGQKLLSTLYKLSATAAFGGSSRSTMQVSFRYPRITSVFSYLARDARTDVFSQLTVLGGVPSGAKVVMQCARGGCSPRHTTFKLKGNNIAHSTKAFLKLPRGAAAYLEILKPNFIGKVLEIANSGHGREVDTVLCLPPGVHKPLKCHK